MDALDSVLADLVHSDRDCAYATIKREPLEALIREWTHRGDQMTRLSGLLLRARNQLAQEQHSTSSKASRESDGTVLPKTFDRCLVRNPDRRTGPHGLKTRESYSQFPATSGSLDRTKAVGNDVQHP